MCLPILYTTAVNFIFRVRARGSSQMREKPSLRERGVWVEGHAQAGTSEEKARHKEAMRRQNRTQKKAKQGIYLSTFV